MTSWIRRRFDSAESDDIPESPEPASSVQDAEKTNNHNHSTEIVIESETDNTKTNGGHHGSTRGVTKVKTQWQRAVRKLSVNSSGYGSASSEPSPCISLSGSRASMEKPAWLLKQHASCQPRSRHLSINIDGGGAYPSTVCRTAPAPIPEGRPVYTTQRSMPSTSLPPYAGHLSMTISPRYRPDTNLKSRTPSGSSSGEGDTGSGSCSSSGDEKMTEEFPYGRAFKAAMGRVTTFPDGTEAVMIDSAIALEAFQQEQMVRLISITYLNLTRNSSS